MCFQIQWFHILQMVWLALCKSHWYLIGQYFDTTLVLYNYEMNNSSVIIYIGFALHMSILGSVTKVLQTKTRSFPFCFSKRITLNLFANYHLYYMQLIPFEQLPNQNQLPHAERLLVSNSTLSGDLSMQLTSLDSIY